MINASPPVLSRPRLDPHYLDYARRLRQLHALVRAGEGDTDRADEVRDAMDASWETLAPDGRELARALSADLNTIGADASRPASPEKLAEKWAYWSDLGDLDSSLVFWEEAFRLDEDFAKTAPLVYRAFDADGRLEDVARFLVRIAEATDRLPSRLHGLCRKYLESVEKLHDLEEESRKARETLSEVHSQLATVLATPVA